AFTFFWEGDIATYQSKPEEAIFYYNKYLQMGAPTYGEANKMNAIYGLGCAYMQRKDYSKSVGYFLQVIKYPITQYSPDIEKESYLNLADCYLMLKEYDKAQEIYKTIYTKEILLPDYAYYKLTQIIGIKNQNLKEIMLSEFESLYPNSYYKEKAKYEQILTLMNQFKFEQAITLIQTVINNKLLTNTEDELYAQLGLCYYSLNKMDSASQVYISLIQKFPNSDYSSEALTNLKTIYVQEERIQEYIELLNLLNIDVNDREKDSLLYATTQIDLNKISVFKRIALMKNYLVNYPNGIYSAKVNLMLAELQESNKQLSEASKHYLEVIDKRSNPFVEIALYKYARMLYFDLKQYDSAAVYFTMMLAETKPTPEYEKEALRALLRCYYFTKKWDSADVIANRLIQYPTLPQDDKSLISFITGKMDYDHGDYARSIHYLGLVDENSLCYQEASLYLINSYYLMKSYDSAQNKAIEFVKNKYANNPYIITKVYLLLGDIFKDEGDLFNARATYESIVERGQDSSLIEIAREQLILMSTIKNEPEVRSTIPIKKEKKK
ncbi:MAG: tetratricopeptide repeat protein, partial [Chitinophagaceae bacterium]